MATRKKLCGPPCGDYAATIVGGRVLVTCGVCGPAGRFTATGARKLARELAGPLGRFQTSAPRRERERLAELLEAAARRLDVDRTLARAQRNAARRGRA